MRQDDSGVESMADLHWDLKLQQVLICALLARWADLMKHELDIVELATFRSSVVKVNLEIAA